MSTQPEPATEAGPFESIVDWLNHGDEAAARYAFDAALAQATAAARAEVARQVRETRGRVREHASRGHGGWSDGFLAAIGAVLALLEDAAPRQPEPETEA